MPPNGRPEQAPAAIDLQSVRDTLRYLESDLRNAPRHAKLRSILGLALAEISRIETIKAVDAFNSSIVLQQRAAHFVPAKR